MTQAKDYDVIVIGGGPAGYVAAIRSAQLGLRTACVEKWINKQAKPALGGTCLNVGCIPSKSLLESSETYEQMCHHSEVHGIKTEGVTIDIATMIERKDKIVSELTSGIAQLFKANKIDWLQGQGKLLAKNRVEVSPHEGEVEVYQAKNIILASGSSSIELPIAPLSDDIIVDNVGALNWQSVPKRLGIIGAGVIGLELGSVWRRLGAEVTILEANESLLAAADIQVSKVAGREFKKQGLNIQLGAMLQGTEIVDNGADGKEVILNYTNKKGEQQLNVDALIVAVGRRPNSQGIADASLGLAINERGQIEVDEFCQTNLDGVYAIGDVVRGPMLAHKGSEEGVAVAERIAGQKPHLNYDAIPWAIYTQPEIAWVGKTEQELKEQGISYKIGSFSFAANGRAKAMEQATGLVKVIADENSDRVLGVHIIGPMASELIGQAVIAIECENSSEDLARTIFAHPSLSESFHEAALAVDNRAIHAVNRK